MNVFSKDYFSEHYRALEDADYTAISREDYLKELERLDIEVGKKNNLGEIKSFVLLLGLVGDAWGADLCVLLR